MNIIEAITDDQLFRPFFQDKRGSIATWQNWMVALRVLYGLPVRRKHHDLIRQCTGRDPAKLPSNGFNTALFLTGRRSGKSRIAATICAFEAALAGHESKLSPGEMAMVPIVSVTKLQSRIVSKYLRALFAAPLLQNEVVSESASGFQLRSGTRLEILVAEHRSLRGYTALCFCADEISFMGTDPDAKIRSDGELIRAARPALASIGGKLVCISSPYNRGTSWTYLTYMKNFANDAGRVLVWNAPSRVMNSTLPQSVVDDALAEDLQAAKSEYLGEFRDDVAALIPRDLVEKLVVRGRTELMPQAGVRYHAFCDIAGGVSEKSDDAALCIAHVEGKTIVIDKLFRARPPFSPYDVIRLMVDVLRSYGIASVTGDRFSPGFCPQTFAGHRIRYIPSKADKSQLYIDLLPKLASGQIELPDIPDLQNQLCSLERRTRSGGKDVIDHPRGGHDDLANVLAGVCQMVSRPVIKIGALPGGTDRSIMHI